MKVDKLIYLDNVQYLLGEVLILFLLLLQNTEVAVFIYQLEEILVVFTNLVLLYLSPSNLPLKPGFIY
ncbi:MAG: hypothetical protein EBY07_16715 [Actinobacteria bacterium]|nr:hypothetical protein [Actinomycetota bacterium]